MDVPPQGPTSLWRFCLWFQPKLIPGDVNRQIQALPLLLPCLFCLIDQNWEAK